MKQLLLFAFLNYYDVNGVLYDKEQHLNIFFKNFNYSTKTSDLRIRYWLTIRMDTLYNKPFEIIILKHYLSHYVCFNNFDNANIIMIFEEISRKSVQYQYINDFRKDGLKISSMLM